MLVKRQPAGLYVVQHVIVALVAVAVALVVAWSSGLGVWAVPAVVTVLAVSLVVVAVLSAVLYSFQTKTVKDNAETLPIDDGDH